MKLRRTLIIFTLLALGMGQASALEIVATSDPIINGSGVGRTARYEKVANYEGKDLDMVAKMLAYSPESKKCWFLNENGDMRFNFLESTPGMVRKATIRWTLVESGTDKAVTIPNFAFTVDDLDDAATHRESLTTSDATSYTLNSPTNVAATLVGSTLTATGSTELETGDPKGAITMHFTNVSSVEISYQTIAGNKSVSAFHHDGNDDFVFDAPVETDIGKRLYYTYQFTNSSDDACIKGAFFDDLLPGLTWDTNFTPIFVGSMHAGVTYSNGGRDASISELLIPPGGATMTLRTAPTGMTGVINNDATITPEEEIDEPLVAEASINLEGGTGGGPPPAPPAPPAPDLFVDFCASGLGDYGGDGSRRWPIQTEQREFGRNWQRGYRAWGNLEC